MPPVDQGPDRLRSHAAAAERRRPLAQQGGAVRGAALEAIGGAIAGDAGKGAAIGAGVGAAGGAMRLGSANRQAAQAQQQAARSQYDKAYAVCLEGRGYQVR